MQTHNSSSQLSVAKQHFNCAQEKELLDKNNEGCLLKLYCLNLTRL